jgi:hypothetical protein
MKIAIVVPAHVKPTAEWIDALDEETKHKADVIIVDDSDGHLGRLPKAWRVFGYEQQKKFLGHLYYEFDRYFHHGSACRVFGHILAYKEKYDIVIGLDSDCVVQKGFISDHLRGLNKKAGGWQNTIESTGYYARGYPYHMRNWKTVANMGLWDETLDLNGKDRNEHEPKEVLETEGTAVAPIPFSGMNFAIKREAIPAFLFIPNFCFDRVWFKRIDDIWGGYIFQKLAHLKHQGISYGGPVVRHVSEVIPKEDEKAEQGMYHFEEQFIKAIDMMAFMTNLWYEDEKDYVALYKRLLEFKVHLIPEFNNLIPIMQWWIKVWEKYE